MSHTKVQYNSVLLIYQHSLGCLSITSEFGESSKCR